MEWCLSSFLYFSIFQIILSDKEACWEKWAARSISPTAAQKELRWQTNCKNLRVLFVERLLYKWSLSEVQRFITCFSYKRQEVKMWALTKHNDTIILPPGKVQTVESIEMYYNDQAVWYPHSLYCIIINTHLPDQKTFRNYTNRNTNMQLETVQTLREKRGWPIELTDLRTDSV